MQELEEEKVISEILDASVPEDYFSDMNEDQKEDFVKNLLVVFTDRIVKKLAPELPSEKYEDFLKILKSDSDAKEILKFLIKNIDNSMEKIGEEIIEFKADIYELTN